MPTGTINDLNQALKCAGKCDCCEKLQQQINTLKAAYEKSISRLRGTDRDNRRNSPDKDLQKIKKQISAIERYINALDSAGKQMIAILKNFTRLFNVFK